MEMSYVVSWFANFIILSLLVAMISDAKKIRVEDHPLFVFAFIFVLPVLLEAVCFYLEAKPFLKVVLSL